MSGRLVEPRDESSNRWGKCLDLEPFRSKKGACKSHLPVL